MGSLCARVGVIVLAAGLSWLLFTPVAVPDDGKTGKLLQDTAPESRLRTAMAAAKKQDVAAIPLLIDLLAEVSPTQRHAIEVHLQELAGEWAPRVMLTGEDYISRCIRRDAWSSWWRHTDGPLLLNEFRKRTPSAADLIKIRSQIRQLGDKSFQVRQQAQADLVSRGRAVVPLLRAGLSGTDLEQRRRLDRCLEAISRSENPSLPVAAARLLALRKPAGAVEALLAFVPWTEDERLAAEVQRALAALAVRGDQNDPALMHALGDPLPMRRGVAAEVLAGQSDARQFPAIRKLFADPDPAVRLCAAVALVHARDRQAVPALIDLAADLPAELRREALDLLQRLAGPQAPPTGPGDDVAARARDRTAWQAWWQKHAATLNLAQLHDSPMHKARLTARASNSSEAQTAEKAVDGDPTTTWNAGDYAPQWLEVDLGRCAQLGSIRLVTAQLPAGETVHEVWVSTRPIADDRARAKLLHTFRGNTDHGQELKFDFPTGMFARYVQIRTTQSPSWIAWVDVELRVGRSRISFAMD